MSEHDGQMLDEINPADIRFAAMNFLARREHSRQELWQKLRRRFPSEELIEIELNRLAQENLQSDARFALSYARQRCDRGYGLLRIQLEMRERGLSNTEIDNALESIDADWYLVAAEVYQKKFGQAPAADLKEKSKRSRFMQYRGFDSEYYQHLLSGITIWP